MHFPRPARQALSHAPVRYTEFGRRTPPRVKNLGRVSPFIFIEVYAFARKRTWASVLNQGARPLPAFYLIEEQPHREANEIKTMRPCVCLVPEDGAAIPHAAIAQHLASFREHVLRISLMPIVRRYGQNGNSADAAVDGHGTRLSLALGIVFECRSIAVVFDLPKLKHLWPLHLVQPCVQ